MSKIIGVDADSRATEIRKARQERALNAAPTLCAGAFDFEHTFPPPNDESMRRADRQGLFDQKESDDMNDAEWLAVQHVCWMDELNAYAGAAELLVVCISQGVDAATGERPRNAVIGPRLKAGMATELARCLQQRVDLLEDYARYFGVEAAEQFDTYTASQHCAVVSAQRSLF